MEDEPTELSYRIEKLTEVIAELCQPSYLSQPTSNSVVESAHDLSPPTTTSATATSATSTTTTPFASDGATETPLSPATAVQPYPGGGDSEQMSESTSKLESGNDADALQV